MLPIAVLVIAIVLLVIYLMNRDSGGSSSQPTVTPTATQGSNPTATESESTPADQATPPPAAQEPWPRQPEIVAEVSVNGELTLDNIYITGKSVERIVGELMELDYDLQIELVPDGFNVGPEQVEFVSPEANIQRGDTVVVHYVPETTEDTTT